MVTFPGLVAMTGSPVFRVGRIYLGWQYVLAHPDPGPSPRRPVPPEQEQLSPGWIVAQRREERLLTRYWKVSAGACLAAAALVLVLGTVGPLNAALTAVGAAVFVSLAGLSVRAVWRGNRALRATIATEVHRVAAARAVQEGEQFGRLEDHARQFRSWQASQQMFAGQPLWYPVVLPAGIDRVDVAGGTLAGWSALLTVVAGARLATGGEVTMVDLSEGAVARDLVALAADMGVKPLVWVLPDDLPRLDLGVGMPAEPLADVLAASASADRRPVVDPIRPATTRSWSGSSARWGKGPGSRVSPLACVLSPRLATRGMTSSGACSPLSSWRVLWACSAGARPTVW